MNIIKILFPIKLRACVLENGSDLHIRASEDTTPALGLLKHRKNAKLLFFTLRGTYVNGAIIAMLYIDWNNK